jgi:hypothetical protein
VGPFLILHSALLLPESLIISKLDLD